jgi:hypothetical protein
MRYRVLLFCLITGVLSQRTGGPGRAFAQVHFSHAPDLVIADDGSPADADLLLKPFIPRKIKSKARKIIEISNGIETRYSHSFIPLTVTLSQESVPDDDCENLFLRGPPACEPPHDAFV